jgi:methyl-accepting chemotaxis protein
VVAEEVRNLAARSADAARNTAELIESTVERVRNGNELVDRTSAAFGELRGVVGEVATYIEQIADASQEQRTGLGQVGSAMSEVDRVTQRNAASAEETASSVKELREEVQQVLRIIAGLAPLAGKQVSFDDHAATPARTAVRSNRPALPPPRA